MHIYVPEVLSYVCNSCKLCVVVFVCMCVRSTQVTQEVARVVMNYIDFRTAVECLFCRDIIRTEKLYKIAAVLTIKIKKYLCTHCYSCSPPHNCATTSIKMLKVWESLIVKPITP